MITLFQDKVLIKAIKEKKESLIELPEGSISYEPFRAEVLETGPGKVFIEVESETNRINVRGSAKIGVKKGDIVIVKHNVDYPVKINGQWLSVVKESDILAVYE